MIIPKEAESYVLLSRHAQVVMVVAVSAEPSAVVVADDSATMSEIAVTRHRRAVATPALSSVLLARVVVLTRDAVMNPLRTA